MKFKIIQRDDMNYIPQLAQHNPQNGNATKNIKVTNKAQGESEEQHFKRIAIQL